MVANKEVTGTNLLKLTYTADAEQVEKGLAYSFNKNKKHFNIHGFRPGHAPRKLVEQYYGEEVLFDDAASYIITDMYYASIPEIEAVPVSDPQNVNIVKMDKNGMEFTLEIYTKPEVRLGQYKGLEITDVSAEVTDEDIENALKNEAEKNSRMVTVEDRPAEKDDTVNIDFEGFTDGVAFEGGKGTNYKLRLGSGQFIPGFEDQLIGANTGDEVTVNVRFPDDYQEESLKGKDAEFKVKVNEIQKQEIPEINDDFASDVSEFDTLAEYKEDIAKKLAESKAKTAKSAMTEEALKKAIDNAETEIPDCMIDREVDDEYFRTENQMKSYGLTMDAYCGYMGTTPDKFRENIRPQAALNVKRDLVLEAIAAEENMTVTDEEFEEEFKKAAEYMHITVEEVKERFEDRKEMLAADIKQHKAVDLILESAVKVQPEEKAEAEAAETADDPEAADTADKKEENAEA